MHIEPWKQALVDATEQTSLPAIEGMSVLLMRRVMDAQLGWSPSDAYSPAAGSALVRVSQGTLEQFLARWSLITNRSAR
jgi:hypothetical protein